MFVSVLIAIAVVVILLFVVVMLRPNDFAVSRSLKMTTTAEKAFGQVNDLHYMNAWNPWLSLDPQVKQTYEGPPSGVGAVYSWDGNSNVGAGRQTIIESRPYEFVRTKVEFFRPFAGVNETQFTFVPEGAQTVVTWSMTGKLNLITKTMGLFVSMDKMCGGSFEKGLADMKRIVES